MFVDEWEDPEPQPDEWPTWYKDDGEPIVYSWVGEFYVVLPRPNTSSR